MQSSNFKYPEAKCIAGEHEGILIENMTKTALICLALQHFREIKGRTRLQKIMYLTNITGWNAIKDYMFYQYGPYSEWVKDEIERLADSGIVEEEESESYDDKKMYNYRLTPEGEEFSQHLIDQIGRPELIEQTRRLFKELQHYTSDDLEVMTSLAFLKRSDPSKENDRLVKLVKLYKPRFTEERIRKNLEVFELLARYN